MPLHLMTDRARQAPLALCPGDPDRARLVARELLDGAVLVTRARGLLGYTGRYRGIPVTIQTTGMGGGSTAIVVHELIELGARVLVRAGSTGGLQPDLALGTMIVAERARAEDGAALALWGRSTVAADRAVTDALEQAARASGRSFRRGAIVTTDLFYDPEESRPRRWTADGLLSVEMEAATLFALAARAGARAGCLLYVSNLLAGEPGWADPSELRAAGLRMAEVALDGLVAVGA